MSMRMVWGTMMAKVCIGLTLLLAGAAASEAPRSSTVCLPLALVCALTGLRCSGPNSSGEASC